MAYTIHPIVLGSKRFDKGMMTYQFGYGQPYTIPIYGWLIKGGDKRILVDTGESHPIQSPDREAALGGKIYTFAAGLARHGLTPEDIDLVLHTHLHNDHCENDEACVTPRSSSTRRNSRPSTIPIRSISAISRTTSWRSRSAGRSEPCPETLEVAPGIRMVHTPAHTEGGMSVFRYDGQGHGGHHRLLRHYGESGAAEGGPGHGDGGHSSRHGDDAKRAYDILLDIKGRADILLPLHEPRFATGEPIG